MCDLCCAPQDGLPEELEQRGGNSSSSRANKISAQQMTDLLNICCSEASKRAWHYLEQYDKQHTHLLEGRAESGGKSSSSRRVRSMKRQDTEQQQEQESNLVEELLLTCVLSGAGDIFTKLVRTQAAQQLGGCAQALHAIEGPAVAAVVCFITDGMALFRCLGEGGGACTSWLSCCIWESHRFCQEPELALAAVRAGTQSLAQLMQMIVMYTTPHQRFNTTQYLLAAAELPSSKVWLGSAYWRQPGCLSYSAFITVMT